MTSTPSYPIQSVRPTSIGEPLSIQRHHDSEDQRQKQQQERRRKKSKSPQNQTPETQDPELPESGDEDSSSGTFDLLA